MSKIYIDKKEFYKLMVEWKTCQSNEAYQKIGKNFLKIATNYLNKARTINYTQDRKDDMISDITWMMIKKIDCFDHEKYDDPFAYFTSICRNAVSQTFNKKHRDNELFVRLNYMDNFDTGIE